MYPSWMTEICQSMLQLLLLLTLTEAPSLVPVIVIGGGAPQSAVPPSLSDTVGVFFPQEEVGKEARLPIGRSPIHHRNCRNQRS